MKLLVVIPGFGPDFIELKKALIKRNINIIKKTYVGEVNVKVFNYGTESCGIQCDEVFEKGVVGQFIYKYITPDYIKNFTNIMILLDDIELSNNFNVDIFIKNLDFYKLDIISPILDKTSEYSHNIMIENKNLPQNKVRITAFVELFCYIMSYDGYLKWYNLLDDKTFWLWGIDMALYYNNIKCAIIDEITIHHFLKNKSYKENLPCPRLEFLKNKEKFKLINIEDVHSTYKYLEIIK